MPKNRSRGTKTVAPTPARGLADIADHVIGFDPILGDVLYRRRDEKLAAAQALERASFNHGEICRRVQHALVLARRRDHAPGNADHFLPDGGVAPDRSLGPQKGEDEPTGEQATV